MCLFTPRRLTGEFAEMRPATRTSSPNFERQRKSKAVILKVCESGLPECSSQRCSATFVPDINPRERVRTTHNFPLSAQRLCSVKNESLRAWSWSLSWSSSRDVTRRRKRNEVIAFVNVRVCVGRLFTPYIFLKYIKYTQWKLITKIITLVGYWMMHTFRLLVFSNGQSQYTDYFKSRIRAVTQIYKSPSFPLYRKNVQ